MTVIDRKRPKAVLPARASVMDVRELAGQAFSRAAGAPLVEGNAVRLLRDARENYPAWLGSIGAAREHINFESYIIHADADGERFADALIEKAREGVTVRLIYDWLGGFGKTPRRFWNRLRDGGVEVRCYNPPRLYSPLGWLSRDHRKMLSVDGKVGFITGLCVGRMWTGDASRGTDPWRDTGIEVRGPAVADIEKAFWQVWGLSGETPPPEERRVNRPDREGNVALRVIATVPATYGMFRLDQLIAALARKRVWLTDAYYAGTTPYVQALRAAALDGVDVRLLVPNGTDIPLLRPLSRAGYRPLLEAGVRVFEWNGSMLHAKTAVADGRWSRVGSTNLNIASWMGNYELDALIEDEAFAAQMEQMYLEDLSNSTEVVLDARHRVRVPGAPQRRRRAVAAGGSGGRAAAGALRIGNAVGAAFTNKRILEPVEARLMLGSGALLLAAAILFYVFPSVLVYPVVVLSVWFGIALVYRAFTLYRDLARKKKGSRLRGARIRRAIHSGSGQQGASGPKQ